ncbi:hypothetical protein QCA50_013460 [Cerrena zonata]|uniref:Uncharacterized protein n=1 Tax=Cerrena zonata TaxID=2478898 RepID=A0AAW0G235_9APHY
MWVWIFEPVPENDYAFRASGVDYDLDSYVLEGTYSISDDGVVEVDFQITYESGSPQEYYKGRIDEKGSLIGFKGFSPDNVTEDNYASRFIVRRIPPDIMVHRPSPMEFEENAPRALWRFARDTIMMQTRRKMWSWSYFRGRRDLRRRYVELNIRTWEYGPPPSSEETEEFLASRKALIPDDALMALNIRKELLRTLPKHFDIPCDGCGEPIGGARIICMDCRKNDSELWHTVDFCDDPRCYSVTVTAQNRDYLEKPHLPTHTFMKIRTYVHWRDLIDAASNAQSELDRYRGPNAGDTSESDSDEAEDETDETREVKNEEGGDGDEDASGEKSGHKSSTEEEAGSDDQQSSRSSTAAKLSNCFACHSPTEMPCWYCTVCTDCVICDSCESQTLLPCVACNKTFIQPTWWYGLESKDRFVCNICTVKGAEPSERVNRETLHVYTHPLVRARERVDDEDSEPSTTADRLELLESTVRSIQDSFNTRFGKLEDTLALLQQAITNLMELKSESQTT